MDDRQRPGWDKKERHRYGASDIEDLLNEESLDAAAEPRTVVNVTGPPFRWPWPANMGCPSPKEKKTPAIGNLGLIHVVNDGWLMFRMVGDDIMMAGKGWRMMNEGWYPLEPFLTMVHPHHQ